ncbi:tyrosine-type recombinase/integrase [Gemmatimonadota bacterium]
MSGLGEALDQYLATRRGLGYELRNSEKLLRSFVGFMQQHEAHHITTQLAVDWAKQPREVELSTWTSRLSVVRQFALWVSASDQRTEIPATALLPHRYQRKPPYIYTDDEIQRLLEATRQLPSTHGLRAHSYTTLIGLLAVSGMRLSEALSLDCRDADLDEGILTIRHTKFGKTRLIPVHSSTCRFLQAYARRRDHLFPAALTPAFFIGERGARITGCATRYNFAVVSRQTGLREPAGGYRHGHGPRLHDLRHRFAVTTLLNWYRAGLDVEREIPKLSTYLGHVHMTDTYWYIEAVPELLQLATDRLVGTQKEDLP